MRDTAHGGPGRPDADECLPYYLQYIQLVPDGHIVVLLEHQITKSAAFLHAFTPQEALWLEAPGVEHPRDRRARGRRRARLRLPRPGGAARHRTGPSRTYAPSPTPWPA